MTENHISIQTQDLHCQFGDLHAVDGITFEVETGTIFGFLGPNGAGKTTTIRLLLGLLEPSAGSARVLGFDTHTQADQIRLNCGALLEHSGLYERLSAEDNLDLFGRIWHLSSEQRTQRIQNLLENMGLYERRKEIVQTWSHGMKQKLAVARTLMHDPKLVFLDEPTAGLDPLASSGLREDLVQMARRHGVTVFLTTHNLAEAEKICDRVGVINKGKLISVGSPDELRLKQGTNSLLVVGRGFEQSILNELKAMPDVTAVEIQDHHLVVHFKQETESGKLVQFLAGKGVMIDEVRKGKASLEDAFLALLEEEE
ncbi:MAG TPA: ABC transporter ATP-binding protein [Anaerolineaceae bacterium]|nr:ABC transporter ATP-binding protein [Anaerolineaceae bacterium]